MSWRWFLLVCILYNVYATNQKPPNMDGNVLRRKLHRSIENPVVEHGSFLRQMELFAGSIDPQIESVGKPNILVQPPGQTSAHHLFGLFNKDKKSMPIPTPTKSPLTAEAKRKQDEKLLEASLVKAYTQINNPSRYDLSPMYKVYVDFLKHNQWYTKDMKVNFQNLDYDSSGYLEANDITHAVKDGKLSVLGAKLLKSWDVNFSHRISWTEFALGPFFLVLLQRNKPLLAAFKRNVPGSMSNATQLYRGALTSYQRLHPESFGLIEENSDIKNEEATHLNFKTMLDVKNKNGVHTELTSLDQARAFLTGGRSKEEGYLSSLGLTVDSPEEEKNLLLGAQKKALAALKLTVKESRTDHLFDRIAHGIRKAYDKVSHFFRFRQSQKTAQSMFDQTQINERTRFRQKLLQKSSTNIGVNNNMKNSISHSVSGDDADPRPKSKFGIPSKEDEICVVCQYVMQRIEKALETKVVDDFTAFDDMKPGTASTGGFPGLEQVSGRATGSRRDKWDLIVSRGMRSPTRMIREVAMVLMRRACGDTAPILFREACHKVWEKRRELSWGIYRRLDSGANCEFVKLCDDKTYFSKSFAVHYPKKSVEFNGGRGMCGLGGGPNSRAGGGCGMSASANAAKILEQVGKSMFEDYEGEIGKDS